MAKKEPNIFTATPGSTEWIQAWDSMSPQDQVSYINLTENAPTMDFSSTADFGDESDPTQSTGTVFGIPPALGGGYANTPFAGYDIDPIFAQLAQTGGGAALPELTSKGALEPFDITQKAKRVNLMQDLWTSIADVIGAATAGPGAIDPTLFQPVVTMPTDRLKTPGITRLASYYKDPGYKGFIARAIRDGMTDDQAIGEMFNLISRKESATVSPESKRTRQAIIDSLPPSLKGGNQIQLPSGQLPGATDLGGYVPTQTGGAAGREAFDTLAIFNWANDLYSGFSEDQAAMQAGWEDPQNPGTWYTEAPTENESYLTTKFHNLGLPTPVEQYTDPKWLEAAAPGYGEQQAALPGELQAGDAQVQALLDAYRQEDRRNTAVQEAYNRIPKPMSAAGQQLISGARGLVPATGVPYASQQAPRTDLSAGGGGFARPGGMRPFIPPPTRSVLPGQTGTGPYTFQNDLSLVAPVGRGDAGKRSTEQRVTQEAAARRPRVRVDNKGNVELMQGFSSVFQPLSTTVRQAATTKTKPLTKKEAQQSKAKTAAASRAFKQAHTANWNRQYGHYDDPAAAARIDARMSAESAQSQGRTPFIDAYIQRLLGQRAFGGI